MADCWSSNAETDQDRFNQTRNIRFTNPPKTEAGESDSKLSRRKVGIEMRSNMAREFCSFIPFRERVQLSRSDFDQREFGCNEKAVQKDQRKDGQKVKDNRSGRSEFRFEVAHYQRTNERS